MGPVHGGRQGSRCGIRAGDRHGIVRNSTRGGGSYRGQASINLTVYDMTNDGERSLQPNAARPDRLPAAVAGRHPGPTEMSEKQFMDKFINYLAQQIGQKFYDYDPMADFAGHGL